MTNDKGLGKQIDYEARLCACGCKEPLPSGKTSQWKVRRYIFGHNRRSDPKEYEVRDCGYKTSCWVWLRAKTKGYGRTWDAATKKDVQAHTFMYRKYKGEIPTGLQLDHLCRNRICCNPDHLEPVTPKENVLRGLSTKIDSDMAREIRNLRRSGVRATEVASSFGLSVSYTNAIARGEHYVDEF